MYYFDYCATTPTNPKVLDYFFNINKVLWANPNSKYSFAKNSAKVIDDASKLILNRLDLDDFEVIYTSGATEANNLALKGYCLANVDKGKHIITSPYEHSSIVATLNYLQKNGFEISVIDTLADGSLDLESLKRLMRNDTILVTITATNSEVGILSDIDAISEIVGQFPNCHYHVDFTQLLGKMKKNLNKVDMISFSGHKIYGIKGIGALIKKQDVKLIPTINGGKSTTIYRAGTPPTELIASLGKAIELIYDNLNLNSQSIIDKSCYIKNKLKMYEGKIFINSNDNCLPSIINISIPGNKAIDLQSKLEAFDIFVSTQTACSLNNDYSATILKLTNDMSRAESSLRISISHLTTFEEIDYLIKKIGELL